MTKFNPHPNLRDTRLMAKALEQRWPIKPEIRELIIKRLAMIAGGVVPKGVQPPKPREMIAAARALMAAESQNQADEHHQEGTVVRHDHEHILRLDAERSRLSALASRLGIGTVADGPEPAGTRIIDASFTPADRGEGGSTE